MELVARCSVLSTRSSSFSPRSMMTSMFATIISFTWSISACTLKNKHNWDVLIIGHPKYLKTIDTSLIMNTVHAHVVILSGSPAEAESEAFLLNLLISLKAKKNFSWATFYLAMTNITWQWRGWTLCSWQRQLLSGLSAQTVLRTCPTLSLRIWTPRLDHRQSLDRKKVWIQKY